MATPVRKIDTFLGIPNFSQLFPPPNDTYKYLAGSSSYLFDPNALGHSHINAWWLAELSLLSYCERAVIEEILKRDFPNPTQEFSWLECKKTNTQGFKVETGDYIVMAFRGTEFPRPSTVLRNPKELLNILADIRTDILRFSPQTIINGEPKFDQPVHPGFAQALQSIWPQIQEHVSSITKPLWLTGHSLGAAIATLMAYQLPELVKGLYTFGSPCVGTSEFAKSFNDKGLGSKTYRYLHGNDAIANALESRLNYEHVVQPFKLDAGMRRGWLLQGLSLILGSTTNLDLLDHPPILYNYECWNQIP
jgi:triacylglycerol lipase